MGCPIFFALCIRSQLRWLLKEPFFDVSGSSASGSGHRAVQVTAELQEAAGRNLVAVKVFPVFEDSGLEQPVLLPLNPGQLPVGHQSYLDGDQPGLLVQ